MASAALGVVLLGEPSSAQAPPDPVVAALTSARAAYEQRNYPAAAEQLRAWLKNHGQRPESATARYLLGVTLLESAQPDYAAAGEAFAAAVSGFKSPTTRPDATGGATPPLQEQQAVYYQGYVLRAHALRAQVQANSDAANAAKLREQAQQQLADAVKHFATSGDALAASDVPGAAQLALRSRCDQAETMIRLGQFKEALALVERVQGSGFRAQKGASDLNSEPRPLNPPTQSRYGRLLSYYGGYAAFVLGEMNLAGRFLSAIAPFDDPAVGLHARFLLARAHHLSGEQPEASEHFSTILAEFEKVRRAAEESLRTPGQFHDRLDERSRLEGFLAESPDLFWRTTFYSAALAQEQGKSAESAERLTQFLAKNAQSPLAAEARLRLGICRVDMKRFDDAVKLFAELAEHPQLGDQALWQGGKARVLAADPGNPNQRQQQLLAAIELLAKAAAKAQQMAATDPDAKVRRGDILHDLGEAQFQAGKLPDAATTFQTIVDAAPTEFPELLEPSLNRLAGVLAAAGQLDQSDAVCQKFIVAYSRSPVLPAMMFRFGENALARAQGSEKSPEYSKLLETAIVRYRPVVEKFPEFSHASQARFGMAQAHLRLGRIAEAAALLSGIPQADRNGPLAHVSYILADCLIRTMPENTDDALAAGRVIEQADTAAKLLAEFVNTQPTHPQVPEALVRLGDCRLKVAAVLVDPEERMKNLRGAREASDQVIQKYLSTPAAPMAMMTSARAAAEMNDWGGAVNLLWRFNNDPFRGSPVAPLAMVQLSEALRKVGRAGEAVNILSKIRNEQEAALRNDPARAGWIPRLRVAHGLALKDSGKFPEAQAVFDSVIAEFAGKPEAIEARWRGAQLRKDQAGAAIAGLRQQAMGAGSAKNLETALASLAGALKPLGEAVEVLAQQAKAMEEQGPMRLAALADAADGYRRMAEGEVALAMGRVALDSMKKLETRRAELKDKAGGLPPLRPLEPPLAAVPLQPSEQKARAALKTLIDAAGESPQAIEAMIALNEMYASRGEVDAGIGLLRQALEQGPPQPVADRLRVLLGEALLAKGQADPAAALFEPMSQNPQHPMYARARLGFAIAYLVRKDYENAVARLARFRDKPDLSNLPGITDLALFRLGEAHAAVKQWDAARAAWSMLVERFGNSPYRTEARFRIAEAQREMKQFDVAADLYGKVVQRASSEMSARAQMGIGLCRLEQGRLDQAAAALLAVAFTYDNPELSATALFEAAGALMKAKKPDDAKLALNRLLADQPTGPWAEKARQRLSEIK